MPVGFLLSIFLKSCSTSQAQTFGRWLFPALIFFAMLFSFIALILSWLANDLQITSTAFLLSSISCSFATLVGFVPQECSMIFMQWSLKILTSYFSSVTALSFSVNIISAFSRNPLLLRNGLINFQNSLFVWTPAFVTVL